MHLLYHWRGDNHRSDLARGVTYHLNQASPRLHAVAPGESVWAFTRDVEGRYVLAAELVVSARTLNRPGFRYGPYRVWGSLRRSRYFWTEGAPSVEALIRRDLSVAARGKVLGRSFQGRAAVRGLTAQDHRELLAFSEDLALDARSRLSWMLPEHLLERAGVLDDPLAIEGLIAQNVPWLEPGRRRELTRPARRRDLVLALRERYDGRCQICLWSPPRSWGGVTLCEGHHIDWLCQGGADVEGNLMLLCPNHHRAVHACQARLDWETMSFRLGDEIAVVRLDAHLVV